MLNSDLTMEINTQDHFRSCIKTKSKVRNAGNACAIEFINTIALKSQLYNWYYVAYNRIFHTNQHSSSCAIRNC